MFSLILLLNYNVKLSFQIMSGNTVRGGGEGWDTRAAQWYKYTFCSQMALHTHILLIKWILKKLVKYCFEKYFCAFVKGKNHIFKKIGFVF